MRRLIGFSLVLLGLLLGRAVPVTAAHCPPDAVDSGGICVDKFEASVWQTTDATLIDLIKAGMVTLDDLAAGGATQLGLVDGDLAAAGCPNTGNGCTDVFAVSIQGVMPARFINWFQAVAAARNSGKRLLTNYEWQAAALGTPDPGGTPGAADCNTSSAGPDLTGARVNCVSDVGAFDIVGNLWERVAEWVPQSSAACIPPLFPETNDENCWVGASTSDGPGTLLRGGGFFNGPFAGVFAVNGFRGPSFKTSDLGFRAAR